MVPPPNVPTCVEVRGSRGAILGERLRGFNQENANSWKKTSPQNLWISLLIVLPLTANSAANSRLTPRCLFIKHREELLQDHHI